MLWFTHALRIFYLMVLADNPYGSLRFEQDIFYREVRHDNQRQDQLG